jgi:hypothetical protein
MLGSYFQSWMKSENQWDNTLSKIKVNYICKALAGRRAHNQSQKL